LVFIDPGYPNAAQSVAFVQHMAVDNRNPACRVGGPGNRLNLDFRPL
jgi:hypothetical protein